MEVEPEKMEAPALRSASRASEKSSSMDSVKVTQFVPKAASNSTASAGHSPPNQFVSPLHGDGETSRPPVPTTVEVDHQEDSVTGYRRLAGSSPTSMISASPSTPTMSKRGSTLAATAQWSRKSCSTKTGRTAAPSLSSAVKVMDHFALTKGSGAGGHATMEGVQRPASSSGRGTNNFGGLKPRRPLSARKPATPASSNPSTPRRGVCPPATATSLTVEGGTVTGNDLIYPSTVVQSQKVTDSYALRGEQPIPGAAPPRGLPSEEMEQYIRAMAEHFRELLVYQQKTFSHELEQVRFENQVLKKKLGDKEASAALVIASALEESRRRDAERKEKVAKHQQSGDFPIAGERSKGLGTMGGHSINMIQEQFDRIGTKHGAKLSRLNGELNHKEDVINQLTKTLEGVWLPMGDEENDQHSRVMRGEGGELSESIDFICAQINDALAKPPIDSAAGMSRKDKQLAGDRRRSQIKTQSKAATGARSTLASPLRTDLLGKSENVDQRPSIASSALGGQRPASSGASASGGGPSIVVLKPPPAAGDQPEQDLEEGSPFTTCVSDENGSVFRKTGAFGSPPPSPRNSFVDTDTAGSGGEKQNLRSTTSKKATSPASPTKGSSNNAATKNTVEFGTQTMWQTDNVQEPLVVSAPGSVSQSSLSPAGPPRRRATLSPPLGFTATDSIAMQTDDQDLVLSYKSKQPKCITEGTQFDALQFEIFLDDRQHGGGPTYGAPTPTAASGNLLNPFGPRRQSSLALGLSAEGSRLATPQTGVTPKQVALLSTAPSSAMASKRNSPRDAAVLFVLPSEAPMLDPSPPQQSLVVSSVPPNESPPQDLDETKTFSNVEVAAMSDSLIESTLDKGPTAPPTEPTKPTSTSTGITGRRRSSSLGTFTPEAGSLLLRNSESPVDNTDTASVVSTTLSVPSSNVAGAGRRKSGVRRSSVLRSAVKSGLLTASPQAASGAKKLRMRTAEVQCELHQENRLSLLQESESRIIETGFAFKRALGAINSAATNLILYTDGYAEDLICGSCDHIYTEPCLLFACGHTFCRRCIERTMSLRAKRRIAERQRVDFREVTTAVPKKVQVHASKLSDSDSDHEDAPGQKSRKKKHHDGAEADHEDVDDEEEGVYECSECQAISREGYTPNALVSDLVMRWNFKQRSVQEPIQTVEQLSLLLSTLGRHDPTLAELSNALNNMSGGKNPSPSNSKDGRAKSHSPGHRIYQSGHLNLDHLLTGADDDELEDEDLLVQDE